MKKFSIVIPCYNEVAGLLHLVDEIRRAMDRTDVEVVLVNNGSVDDSAEVLERITKDSPFMRVVTVPVNQGYGYGIVQGLKASQGTYVGWMHGDLQTPFKDALLALSKIESLGEPEDVYVKGSRKGRPFVDQFFTLGMSIFESLLLRRKLFDINAQPNIFHRDFLRMWKNPPHDFSLDLYALYMARLHSMRLVRIPVIFPPRKYGHSHWNFGLKSRLQFIKRTVIYSRELRKRVRPKKETI